MDTAPPPIYVLMEIGRVWPRVSKAGVGDTTRGSGDGDEASGGTLCGRDGPGARML